MIMRWRSFDTSQIAKVFSVTCFAHVYPYPVQLMSLKKKLKSCTTENCSALASKKQSHDWAPKYHHTDTSSGSMVLLQKLEHVPGNDVRFQLGCLRVFEAYLGFRECVGSVSSIHRFKKQLDPNADKDSFHAFQMRSLCCTWVGKGSVSGCKYLG